MRSEGLRFAAVAFVCLALGAGIALLLFVELLHAPLSHTIEALEYFLTSGLVSLLVGAVTLLIAARFVPRLGVKVGIASIAGSVAAILNVIYTPLLMFSARSDLYILVTTLLYVLAISLAFAFLVGTSLTRQLRALHDGALRLASGQFGATVEVRGIDEVAGLGRAFNRMSTELGASFERQRRLEEERRNLIAAVSHDLRTPLASIRAMIESLNDGVVSEPEAVQRYLGLIQQETDRLEQLIEDLFELSRIESGDFELRLTSIPVTELVTETVDGLQAQAEKKGVVLQAICRTAVPPLLLDGPRMERVLVNLIQNAVRHTPSGGEVRVEVDGQDGHVQVTVSDTGEGITAEDQPHIFDRFYRGEKSRSRESGGAGLGLAIARGIVEAHRGRIQVESNPGRGSRFIVTLFAL